MIICQIYQDKQVLPVKEAQAEEPSIAVLPFKNMRDAPEQSYFGDGISEDLISDLSKLPGLLVISRLSSFTYKGHSLKIQQIGDELGVGYALEGNVRMANVTVRINAQLINAAIGHHLRAERYDGDTRDVAWVNQFLKWGYVTLRVASLKPRGISSICTDRSLIIRMLGERAQDANDAKSCYPYVKSFIQAIILNSHWNIKREGGSFAFALAFCPNFPPVKLDQVLG